MEAASDERLSRKTKILLPLLVVAGAVIVAFILVRSAPSPPTQEPRTPPPLVRVIEVEPRMVRFDVESQGTVRPRTEATLNAQVSGRIEWVSPSFAEGGLFRRGEALVRIDARDYRLAVSQAEQQVAQARVRLAREEAEAEIAREEYRDLAADGAVGDVSPLTLHEPQLAGETADGPSVALSATLGGSRRTWTGRVVRTGGGIEPETRMMPLIARVDRPYGAAALEAGAPLPIGLFVEAEISGRRADGVFVLPREALRRTGRWREGEPSRVLVVGEEVPAEAQAAEAADTPDEEAEEAPAESAEPRARLRFRDVWIVRLEGDRAYVSRGLEDGDLVCVSPLETPTDGMVVRVTRAEGEAAPLATEGVELSGASP